MATGIGKSNGCLLSSVCAVASSCVARYGGEEFAVLLPAVDPTCLIEIAERIRRAVGTEAFVLDDGRLLDVTVSIGVAAAGVEGLSAPDRLTSVADQRLYRAKANGRNQVVTGAPAP